MSNPSLPYRVERRRQTRRFQTPGRTEKNFLTKIACNPLITLVSHERIQGNPRKSNVQKLGFRRETARGQEKPNEATGHSRRRPACSRGGIGDSARRHSAAVACSRFGAPCVSGILSA